MPAHRQFLKTYDDQTSAISSTRSLATNRSLEVEAGLQDHQVAVDEVAEAVFLANASGPCARESVGVVVPAMRGEGEPHRVRSCSSRAS